MKIGVDGVLLGAVSHFEKVATILDIGAGTGLLSLMAAQKTNAEIIALEIEKNAFKQCLENIKLNKQENKISGLNISFQDYYKNTNKKFDFIISNPPFFENSQKSANINRNTARHSDYLPKEELIKGVSEILKPKGLFSIILPFEFENSFEHLCLKYGLFCSYKMIILPKENKSANRIIFEFSYQNSTTISEKFIIRETDTNQYTKTYKELTKDFYLHF